MRLLDVRHLFLVTTALIAAGCNAKATEEPPPPPPPPEATCTEAAPVCDPGCAAGESCLFTDGACGCARICISSAPVCPTACGADEFCDNTCSCKPIVTCIRDAPVCPGSGPNSGCAANEVCNGDCACEAAPPPPPQDFLARPSRSTAIDLSSDDGVLAMVNTDDGSVSFFNATSGQESRIARIASSATANSEPTAVVIHPNRTTAFVANRAAGTVSRITGIDTASPRIDGELATGSEPVGMALSPSGDRLWITHFVDGTVVVIDTTRFGIERTLDVGGNPHAIAISNDGDQDEDDEKAFITQFYARPKAGAAITEATDDGKEGVVQVLSLANPEDLRTITLAPLAGCFTAAIGNPPADVTTSCFPNQLYAIAIHTAFGATRAYVTSVAASPAGPVNFNLNMQSLISVIDVESEAEVPTLTKNLNALVKAQQPDTDGDDNIGRRFLNVVNGIDFVNREDVAIAYVTSGASDIVLRVEYLENGEVNVGSPSAFNIPVGQSPQGIVVRHGALNAGAYVANLITRNVSHVSFRDQNESKKIESTTVPAEGTPAFAIWKGKRFFNTSTGIWAKEGWGSCQGCHPFGLTDNVTWSFPAGPRQTVSLDGQFASDDPTDMRALNWTAIFDETADFEINVRTVSGGKGAIQGASGPLVSATGALFSAILSEDGVTTENHQGNSGSLTFLARNRAVCTNANTCPDWDQVNAYIQTIRSPKGKTGSSTAIAEGRAIFEDAGCAKCHAGPKWTISRVPYVPESSTGALPARRFAANEAATTAMDPGDLVGLAIDVNQDATLIAVDDSTGGTPPFLRIACNLRRVGTFDSEGGAAELRQNNTPAMGEKGFNPPSLLNIAAGAPFLHHGAAEDLDAIFDARFADHLKSGSINFAPSASEKAALTAFLLSIDESTTPFDIARTTLLCPE
jgi:hypothetical protein